jgi:hypothetical protein
VMLSHKIRDICDGVAYGLGMMHTLCGLPDLASASKGAIVRSCG